MDRILILGGGRSGLAAAELAAAKGFIPVIADAGAPAIPESLAEKAEVIQNWKTGIQLPQCKTAVLSPGIPVLSELPQTALKCCGELVSEIEFAARYAESKIAAITGTNGKTTVTELTDALFRAAGINSAAAGNIGFPLSKAVFAKNQAVVTEVSTFQLESCRNFAPDFAALLNVASDHINRHGTFEEYERLKFCIFKNAKKSILNASLLDRWKHYCGSVPDITFSSCGKNADFTLENNCVMFHGKKVFQLEKSHLPGIHNAENIMAALAFVFLYGEEKMLFSESICAALENFSLDAHKLELVRTLNGIKFIDDSKATNPSSSVAALRVFGKSKNVIIILGGSDKETDFSCIADEADKIKLAVICGGCRDKIFSALNKKLDCAVTERFEDAVLQAYRAASSGDTVLMSPACASFDFFSGYAQRGDCFKKIVNSL